MLFIFQGTAIFTLNKPMMNFNRGCYTLHKERKKKETKPSHYTSFSPIITENTDNVVI